jgi:2-methylcitrate dehydratase
MPAETVTLPADTNQVRGLAEFAQAFLAGRYAGPSAAVFARLDEFHLDSLACGVSAIALGTGAPRLLRAEALEYPSAGSAGAYCFGSRKRVRPEKAVVANCAAVREWDANGTNFGYDPKRGHTRGEFGHNDFYPVAIAAAQQRGLDGRRAALGMLLVDEIRGRLAEVFALRDHKIDHVLHGAIASAVVYGALLGATVDEIESAVGLVVAHYVPFRAIRSGEQLSDSKGASAALAAETAVLSVHRAMRGFVGPADVFRNPQAIFCLFEPPGRPHASPFDLALTAAGDDFALMGMHFKLGLYEHQSAGAIQGLLDLLTQHPGLVAGKSGWRRITITIYEPAFSIIGDPAKRNPQTRQSADHSMVYIVATLLRKALAAARAGWRELLLEPADYDPAALADPTTRRLMALIEFRHGGPEFDRRYPDGIPTQVDIQHADLGTLSSGLVMYPLGHARNTSGELAGVLAHKFQRLASLGVADPADLRARFAGLAEKSAAQVAALYDFALLGDGSGSV